MGAGEGEWLPFHVASRWRDALLRVDDGGLICGRAYARLCGMEDLCAHAQRGPD